ncbi:MAG TPA: hypothetical protein VN048_18530 [Verrucomicrobiae bacterium]|jgi:hypothetical protein|nr:hypothetical protein [Verrucomicrobiae bacterium]
MSKKSAVICAALLFVTCLAFWIFRPSPRYDLALVEPRLLALKEPYQKVTTAFYADGGSIGIQIIDRDGRKEQFAIPARLGEKDHYTKVFIGAMYDQKPGAIEVSDSEQTKRMLIHVLESMPNRSPDVDVDLRMLRHSPLDRLHFFIIIVKREFEP